MRERYSVECAQEEAELVRSRAIYHCVHGLLEVGKWTREDYERHYPNFRDKKIDMLIGWRDYDQAHEGVVKVFEDLYSFKPDLNPQQIEELG